MSLIVAMRASVAALAFAVVASGSARAQAEPEVDLAELVRQIRRNMVEVEKDIDRIQAEGAKAAAGEAKKKLDELIDSMKARGGQITKDIDEFIKNLPP